MNVTFTSSDLGEVRFENVDCLQCTGANSIGNCGSSGGNIRVRCHLSRPIQQSAEPGSVRLQQLVHWPKLLHDQVP